MLRKCILIADGDGERASACAALLQEAGYAVVVAQNGSEVLEALGETRPDLILLGLQLGDLHVHDVLTVLRHTDAASIPVVMLSDRPRFSRLPEPGSAVVELLSRSTEPEHVLASVRRHAGSPVLDFGTGCGLCGGTSRESLLSFVHLRQGKRVVLDLPVCESCGNRLEKHLKRAIPKRLMRVEPVYF